MGTRSTGAIRGPRWGSPPSNVVMNPAPPMITGTGFGSSGCSWAWRAGTARKINNAPSSEIPQRNKNDEFCRIPGAAGMRTPLASKTDRTKFPTTTTPQSSAPGYMFSNMLTRHLERVKRCGFVFDGVIINARDTNSLQAGQPAHLHAAHALRSSTQFCANTLNHSVALFDA